MYRYFFKRLIDFLISLILMPFVLIIMIFFSILIFIEDKGNPIYCAKRLGKNGTIFSMFKLRTMKINAPDLRNEDGTTFNSENDPRVTRIGRFLRKTSIDEIPQIINVLIGNMSLIGPRPDLPDAINIYNEKIKNKLKVKPGITGYSQAYYRNSSTLEERFEGDVYYAENVSFMLDVKLILKTIKTVLLKENVYRN